MRLLIIGSLQGYMSAAASISFKKGVQVSNVETIDQALESLRSGNGADIIFSDVLLDINSLIGSLSQERFHIPVVACGIGNNPAPAVNAIKSGAKEYLPFPPDPELISAVFDAIAQENDDAIYHDPATEKVFKTAEQVAPSEASILITGESGTGKEVLARFIQRKSRRSTKPFISVNCAAIPEALLESELFGHEKGAFTGSVARRIGKFEEANGGTLLLDEISEMHQRLQAKLLRAIQEKEICRVGGNQVIKVNIRIIATSNRNLIDEIKSGNFREDLYYRLNVINLKIPSLKDRPLDVVVLSAYFVKKYCEVNGLAPKRLSEKAMMELESYPWPGNVRELENAIHRAVLMTDSSIIEEVFLNQEKKTVIPNNSFIGRTVEAVEKDLILGTLDKCLGNRTHAANILGISIRTLRNKLKQYTQENGSVQRIA